MEKNNEGILEVRNIALLKIRLGYNSWYVLEDETGKDVDNPLSMVELSSSVTEQNQSHDLCNT